ncbi:MULTISPECIES: flagellar protein FlaG [Vibrio]|uniref:Flagellar biosynthesis protein FlaG n=1 Tax=Vibrio proteolyticus NBRC 13287 TaxID=1219065 RepID=U2ZFC1_VIBPR|nr:MULTISPECIES: flagellar protein FlaG [Vibrio]NAW59390.1 flagellar protein FlaG [Vibrio sp. V36_P2S2PM302]NAX22672.1 flagellar protein FlaG [Vibrio sp. V39_P1S14PM300]NAX24933.1 flagellar protein FlaG [Vibrio sp. V38_P2S17PM301]NAX29672.1 flagellar protein FlaG [Vibrio sp. V37_P2S8PM304]GAD66371.1 flagellar biosynthesis protein FlaG [Vibrio proteolyticus NBRC 13287]
MEIPSYTSNIQPYGSQSGTKIASENDNAQRLSTQSESSNASELARVQVKPSQSIMEMAQERQRLDKEHRERMVEQMNEFISSINTGLSFRVDEESGRDVVTIYDASTGDIIRQIPDEEMLEVLRRLREQTSRYSTGGILVDKV